MTAPIRPSTICCALRAARRGSRPAAPEDPTAVVLDTQSIRAANHMPAATTGKDAGKKAPGVSGAWPWTP
jgi:hypothetical protein